MSFMLMNCGDVFVVLAAGMMVTPTTPATGAGDGLLIALAVVNVFLLVSPIVIGLVLGLQVRFLYCYVGNVHDGF